MLGAPDAAAVEVAVDDAASVAMTCGTDGPWRAEVDVAATGMRRSEVRCSDRIGFLVREEGGIHKRRALAGRGAEAHAIGAWPIAGIDGFQLGPNKNGGPPDA